MRPSEQIALTVADFDITRGTLSVTKACVGGIDKNCTKTREDRLITLCPRALGVLNRQLRLREQLQRSALRANRPRPALFSGGRRAHSKPALPRSALAPDAQETSAALSTAVHRAAYLGELESDGRQDPLWTAKQHGHSVETMWRVYSAWMDGAVESDIEAIKQAMQVDAVAIPARTQPRTVN